MADIAIFRINYKSDFILTLNSDAGWLTPFCIKFWTGAPSRAYFVGFDGITYTHCAPVDGEPAKLRVQFDDHRLPIGDLKFQISYHFTVADFPTSVEDEVLNQASVIIEMDDAPAQVMLDFTGETAPEIEFSLPAYANEQARIAAEQQRIANEDARIQAEETRQHNEQQRIQHEEERVSEFARLKSESEAATTAANAAATLANEKAQLADDKATLAQAAATLANEKAALAQQKATYAQTQGDYAKEQGDYAKAQGDTAQADHVRAEADHTTAADDHSRAEGDHTTAASDHTRAESDHAAVEVYVDSLGAFDISSYHATGGELAKYADLTAALGTDGANIPEGIRKGGMSVKFVQSSDNNYVQYRYMGTATTGSPNPFLNTANWQGIDDVPTAGSDNLVKSGGVEDAFNSLNASVDTYELGLSAGNEYLGSLENTNIQIYNHAAYKVIKVFGGEKLYISGSLCRIMILATYQFNSSLPYSVTFATGETARRQSTTSIDVTLPSDARYVLVQTKSSNGSGYTFSKFTIDNSSLLSTERQVIEELRQTTKQEFDAVNDDIFVLNNSVLPFSSWQKYAGMVDTASIVNNYNRYYRIIDVSPYDSFYAKTVDNSKYCSFAILKSFTFNPTLPYTMQFATGESQRRTVLNEVSIDSLPSDAHYIAINITTSEGIDIDFASIKVNAIDITKDVDSKIEDVDERLSSIDMEVSELDTLSVADRYFVDSVKALGDWYYSFEEDNAFLLLNNEINIESDGDYIEFNVSRINGNTFNYGLIYSSTCMLGYKEGTLLLKLSSSGSWTTFYGSGIPIDSIKIARSGNDLVVYLNGVLNNTKISGGVFNVAGFGKNYSGTYKYSGSLRVSYNGVSVDYTAFKTINGNKVIVRNGGFLDSSQEKQVESAVLFHKYDNDKFYVRLIDRNSGKYIYQFFKRQKYNKTCYYGNSQSKNIECADFWYLEEIRLSVSSGSASIMQGLQHYIYQIDDTVTGFEHENGYVGGGHGGIILDWFRFYIDDMEIDFDSVTIYDYIYGSTFRYTGKASHYAIDTSNPNYTSDAATLKLDENGDQILACVSCFDYKLSENCRYELDNKLVIKRNGTKFYHCFGSAIEVRKSVFDAVSINNYDGTLNEIAYDEQTHLLIATPIGSDVNLYSNRHQFATIANFYGENLRVRQQMAQDGNNRFEKNNFYCMFYDGAETPRLKIYMVPCITKLASQNLDIGQESFNDGDMLVTRYIREISISDE